MTAVAFLGSIVGLLYGWLANRPGVLILSFWGFLVAFSMLMARDNAKNEEIRQREALLRLHDEVVREALGGTPVALSGAPDALAGSIYDYSDIPVPTAGADWTPLDEAWPIAAPGTFPEEEEIR